MGKRRTPGLTKRGQIWWVNKRIKGIGAIRESTGTTDLAEAERYLTMRIEQLRRELVFGERPKVTFRQAATKYLEEVCPTRSLERAGYAFDQLFPYIGDLDVTKVHDGELLAYKRERLANGIAPGTVNKELMFASRVLNLCARVWRHRNGMPYVDTAPLLQRVPGSARRPTILSWDAQRVLLRELPTRQAEMALFALNTGLRQEELCGLRWDWEVRVPELGVSVFLLPAEAAKNGEERVIVLNSIARSVANSQRGRSAEHVFVNRFGKRYGRLYNGTWRKARVKAGVPALRVHDLRHTFGHRLRAAGVGLEDRADLLGHSTGRMTTHYSAAELGNLLAAAERIVTERPTTLLSAVRTNFAQAMGE
jgi:integrase